MRIYIAAFLMLASITTAYSENKLKIDGSSKCAFEKSINDMVDSLPESEQKEFTNLIILAALETYLPTQNANIQTKLKLMGDAVNAARETLNGKTISDIRSLGQQANKTLDSLKKCNGMNSELLQVKSWKIYKDRSSSIEIFRIKVDMVPSKSFRYITGGIYFADPFGKQIVGIKIGNFGSGESGEVIHQSGKYNPYEEGYHKVISMDKQDVSVYACVSSVVLSSGQKFKFE